MLVLFVLSFPRPNSPLPSLGGLHAFQIFVNLALIRNLNEQPDRCALEKERENRKQMLKMSLRSASSGVNICL